MSSRIGFISFLAMAMVMVVLSGCKSQLGKVTVVGPASMQVQWSTGLGTAGTIFLTQEATTSKTNTVDNLNRNSEPERIGSGTFEVYQETDQLNLKFINVRSGSLISAMVVELTPSSGKNGFATSDIKTVLTLNQRTLVVECRKTLQINANGENDILINVRYPTGPSDCEDSYLQREDPLQVGRPRGVGRESNYFSMDDDLRMGQEFTTNFNSKNASLLVSDDVVLPYLNNMMEKISQNSDNKGLKPKVYFINADIANAFALPGGTVYVFRGLMEQIKTESELAGILGHEWAHAVARHGTRNMTKAIKTQLTALSVVAVLELVAAAKKEDSKEQNKKDQIDVVKKVMESLTLVGAEFYLLAGSREVEEEADMLGAQYAYRANYNPRGIGLFFSGMMAGKASPSSYWVNTLSTHPDHGKRVNMNQERIEIFYPSSSEALPMVTSEFLLAKSALEKFPAMVKGEQANKILANSFLDLNKDLALVEMEKRVKTIVNRR